MYITIFVNTKLTKMKKLCMLSALLSIFLFVSSCKKDKSSPNDNQSELIDKWTLVKIVFNTSAGQETEPFNEGSYIKFDSNGFVYAFVDGETTSSNWKYTDSKSGIWIDGNQGLDVNDAGYDIITMDAHNLVFRSKDYSDTNGETIYAKK